MEEGGGGGCVMAAGMPLHTITGSLRNVEGLQAWGRSVSEAGDTGGRGGGWQGGNE